MNEELKQIADNLAHVCFVANSEFDCMTRLTEDQLVKLEAHAKEMENFGCFFNPSANDRLQRINAFDKLRIRIDFYRALNKLLESAA